jgi:(1->4)-alpha-D-glucan 1-alpha-D-glucosylmutase
MRISATYRLQLQPAFPFAAAVAALPYLAALGISHVYCSPVFAASPGSTHGYDVVDPTRVNDALGGERGFMDLVDAARREGLGLVVDLVPNHMATAGNAWWTDVLRHGRASAWADYFDVHWDADDRVVLPLLGAPYGEALERRHLRLVAVDGEPVVAYGPHRFPLADPEWRPSPDAPPPPLGPDDDASAPPPSDSDADIRHLHGLLEGQRYRLAWWRVTRDAAAYRRFADIDDLIGLRVEDPAEYLHRLQTAAPGRAILVEKVLATDETLPAGWPVAGTTGYEFAAAVTRLFVPAERETQVSAFYEACTGEPASFDAVREASRRDALAHGLAGDVARVSGVLHDACQDDAHLRDFSPRDCERLVTEMLAVFPVYRTYATPEAIAHTDRLVVDGVLTRVTADHPDVPPALVEAVRGAFHRGGRSERERTFVRRFQQVAAAVAAKGDEDTAFYRHARLLALNEVGGDPGRFSESIADFHARVHGWQRTMRFGLRTTTTHDTKRSEDVRARLAVLVDAWPLWEAAVERWRARARSASAGWPDPHIEYYLYQTLVGAWPLSRDRAHTHATKAMREAKRATRWDAPDAAYEAAVHAALDARYDDEAWLADIDALVASLHPADWHASLAQALLKVTTPGVPDVYQGSELWDHRLCDPDNRGPVDLAARAALLATCGATPPDPDDQIGVSKLYLLRRALRLRRAHPDLDPDAAYVPLPVGGPAADRAIAYRRGDTLVAIAPVRTWRPDWRGSCVRLPAGTWHDVFTGRQHAGGGQCRLEAAFESWPVALLERR